MRAASSIAIVAVLALLAGCDVHKNDATKNGDAVHISLTPDGGKNDVAVNVPGFDAKVRLPGLNLGGHMDIDGMKLPPDTQVTRIDVIGEKASGGGGEGKHGDVHLGFASKQTPAAVLAYYRQQAQDAGYTIGSAGDTALAAAKGAKSFALAVSPDGAGSRGTIDVKED